MSTHDTRHEEWLVARLAGEVLPAGVAATLDACADCRAALGDVGRIQATLDFAGELERAAIARAFAPEGVASSREVVSSIAERRQTDRSTRLLMRLAAAILVVGALGIAYRSTQTSADTPGSKPLGPTLSPVDARSLQPSGDVDEVREFTFDGKLPNGGWFQVRVYDPVPGGEVIVESRRLQEPHWTPDSTELARLPARFRWEVRAFDDTGVKYPKADANVVVRAH